MSKKPISYWLTLITIFTLSFLAFFHPITDFSQDLGRHLKMGEIIFSTHFVSKTNLFSYTYPNFTFINTHWLSEVVFYLLNKTFGLSGLLIIMSAFAALSMVFVVVASKSRNAIIVGLTTLLYLVILLERAFLRPEIFSFFFMSIFMWILWRNREHATKWIFMLPILELFWVNMHIYFIVGPLLILLFFLDSILEIGTLKIHWKLKTENWKLLLALALATLATLLNPNFLSGALYPLTVFHNYGYAIEENQSLYFLWQYGLWYSWFTTLLLAIAGLFILLIIQRKQTRPIDWMLSIVFTYLALSAVRNFPLFVLATFPTYIYLLTGWRVNGLQNIKLVNSLTRNKIIWLTLILSIGLFLYWITSVNGIGFGVVPSAERGVNFFIQHRLKGPIFNDFNIGSYLDYRLFPKERVFVDGRPEAYPASFFQKVYIPMQQNPAVFKKEDDRYHFQTIFFSYTDQTPWTQQFLMSISKDPQWQLIYLDTFSAIWVKNTLANQSLIHQFGITPQTISADTINSKNPKDYIHLLYFLSLIGWQQNTVTVAQKILSLDENNCTALSILTQNPTTTHLYAQRFTTNCQ